MTASASHVRSIRPDAVRIAEVLARTHSRKEAAAELGLSPTTLERLCRDQALVALYEALAERGTVLRGGGRGRGAKRKPVRRWSIYWGGVCVWPEKQLEAMTETEAVEVYMLIAPKQVKRAEVTAVEVVR